MITSAAARAAPAIPGSPAGPKQAITTPANLASAAIQRAAPMRSARKGVAVQRGREDQHRGKRQIEQREADILEIPDAKARQAARDLLLPRRFHREAAAGGGWPGAAQEPGRS
ncbi:hypothetical protein [Stappia stellulata]|uniref:hypothetical protein n=1 Tax=Stappia stellulata TaxID=71235 RepID=UPI0012EB9A7B|nr:hypothetical protein [Stappia stellulata]